MRILVISDTHIPIAANDIPQKIYDEIENADMVIHAGDFVERALLDKLRALKKIKAVCGNMDPQEICDLLKSKEVITIGKFKIGLMHGYGAPADLMAVVGKEFEGVDAIIYGHSHSAVNTVKDGVLYFNPGSPTDKIFASKNTYGILEITDKKIEGEIREV